MVTKRLSLHQFRLKSHEIAHQHAFEELLFFERFRLCTPLPVVTIGNKQRAYVHRAIDLDQNDK